MMCRVDVFADYEPDAWPTVAQVAALPPSCTRLGLDQPLHVVQAAAESMDRAALSTTYEALLPRE